MKRRTKRIPQQDYNSSAAPPWGMAPRASGDEIYERRDPHGRASLEASVIIPMATGFLFAVPAFLGLLLAKAELRYAAAGGLVVFTVATALMLLKMVDLMAKVETWTRLDLDGDGVIGRPSDPDPPVILHSAQRPTDAQDPPEFNVTRDVSSPNRRLAQDLAEFLVLSDRDGFARAKWVGRQLSSGTRVSDGSWREWVGWLRSAGILESDKAGTRLAEGLTLDDALKSILAGGGLGGG